MTELADYSNCNQCGRSVMTVIAHQTAGRCWECFSAGDLEKLREIEVTNRQRSMTVRLVCDQSVRTNKGRSKGSKTTKKRVESAREKALLRLKHLYPDAYRLLYNDERVKAGLLPVIEAEPNHYPNLAASIVLELADSTVGSGD